MIHHAISGNGGTIVARDVEVATPTIFESLPLTTQNIPGISVIHGPSAAPRSPGSSPSTISGEFWMATRPGQRQIHVCGRSFAFRDSTPSMLAPDWRPDPL